MFIWSKKSCKWTAFLILFNELKREKLGNLFIFYESEKSLKRAPPRGTSGIKGRNWFRQWWNCSKHVMVKRLANKTTHCCGSSGKENKQVKAYDQPKRWWQWNETTKAHLAKFSGYTVMTRCKSGMGSFLHKLEPWRTLLGFSFMFTQA